VTALPGAGPIARRSQRGRRLRWLLAGLGLAAAGAQADKPLELHQYQSWTSDDGLPQNSVSAMAETANGFMWFGTHDGLVRFDGAHFQPVPALRDGAFEAGVTSMWVAADDGLWVGTVNQGVSRLQIHEPALHWGIEQGLPSNTVLAVDGASDGRLLVATSRGAALLVDDRFAPLPGVPALPFSDLASAPDGSIWLAARGHPLYRLGADGTVDTLDAPGGSTGVLAMGADGTLWAAGTDGLLRRAADGSQRIFRIEDGLASRLISRLLIDRRGALWIGYEGQGLQRWRDTGFESFEREQGLHHQYVHSLFEDNHGALWIGTSLGAGRLRDAAVLTYDRIGGSEARPVRSVVATTEGTIWAGSDGGGLIRIDGHQLRSHGIEDGLLGLTVRSLALDRDGGLWLAVYGEGLQRLHQGRWQSWTTADGLPSPIIHSLLADDDGSLWIGTADRGLVRFVDGRFESIARGNGPLSNNVRSLLKRRNGMLAVGTATAGIALLADGEVQRVLDRASCPPCEQVYALHEDSEERLWVGSESGLALIDGDRVRSLAGLGDFFGRAVMYIADDGEGGLWLTGHRGVTHLPRASIAQLADWDGTPDSAPPARFIESSDGLGAQPNGGIQPAGAVDGRGRLWLPTSRGVAMVDRERLSPEPGLPRMQIESVLVRGAAREFKTGRLNLEAGDNRIQIGFGGVYTPGMDRPRYQTRLDGLDQGWGAPSLERSSEYAALAPGSYRFRVRPVSSQGVPGRAEASLQFQIAPFAWQRPWFWPLAGLLLAGLLTALLTGRHRRLVAERTQLSQQVELRTRELSEALARAQRLMRAKTHFLANMSHELRTPLTAILGFTEQTLQAVPRALRPSLQRIERHARLLLELVNDVLDASRIDTGQLAIQLQPVAPWNVVEEAINLLTDPARDKGLRLVLAPRWPLPQSVQADPLRLKQILLNLIGNAIKFSDRGEVRVEIAADAERGRWWFEVIDHGIGIPLDQQQRLFRAFEQADISTSRRYGGSGLGLYISRQLAELMNGRIGMNSVPGEGSRFRVDLPLPKTPVWIDRPPPSSVQSEDLLVAPDLGGRVLIAEDVEDLRELFAAMVGSTGASVVTVEHGGRAVELARREPFDLILMDIHMPVLDGREATRQLREAGYRGGIVALTADVLGEQLDGHRSAGCDAVLTKPIDRARLYQLLAHHLPAGDAAGSASADELEALQARLSRRFSDRLDAEGATLREAFDSADDAALGARLHRLKGNAGMFGHPAIGRSAAEAEAALKRGDRAELATALERLLQAIRLREPAG
jgi:signal transduction histidine kinase/ligand-binding sensor domain-containing protein/CheY-like chemotaxis protein